MATLRGTRRAAVGLAIGCWIVLIVGCNAALRTELAASRSLDGAATAIGPVLRDYHRELVTFLGSEESRTIDDFVERLRRYTADRGFVDAHVARFVADLGRLRREQTIEENRYRTAMGEVGALRESAARLHQSAEVGIGLWGTLRRYLDLLLDDVAPVPTPVPEKPRG